VLVQAVESGWFSAAAHHEERKAGAYWMADGGAALAVEAKGLIDAGVVVFAVAFALTRVGRRQTMKRPVHWPSMAVSLKVGAFYADQVAQNIERWWSPAVPPPAYIALLVPNFFADSAGRQASGADARAGADKLPAKAQPFILAWTGTVLAVFSRATAMAILFAALLIWKWYSWSKFQYSDNQ
jgi:hypothetical protein